MLAMTSSVCDNLLSGLLLRDTNYVAYANIGGTDSFKILKFRFTKEENSTVSGLHLTLANVNPTDPYDHGYYNWQRNAATYGKAQNSYFGVLKPGQWIDLEIGYYGAIRVFSGFIQTVRTQINDESTIEIMCVSKSSKLKKASTYMYDNTLLVHHYFQNYPIPTNHVEVWLPATDTNPLIYDIWVDACMRAGYLYADLHYYNVSSMRLRDIDKEYFNEMRGNYYDIAQLCADILNLNMYEDAYGDLYLVEQENVNYIATGTKVLTSDTWVAFTTPYNYRAIEESIVVVGYANTDWEYNYSTNSIRRSEASTIPSGTTVTINYNYCAWTFRAGVDIFDISQWTTNDEQYGKLIATNRSLNLVKSADVGAFGDGTTIDTSVMEMTNVGWAITEAQLTALLTARIARRKKQYFNFSADVIPIPNLDIGDTIMCIVWGTCSSIYSITGIEYAYDAENGLSMYVNAIFYANPTLV